jgi:hypothetical protein
VKHNQSKIYLIISNRAIPKTTTQKTINMSNRDLNKKPGVKAGTRDALAVAVSYKTPTMLLLFKFGKSNVGDRRNTGVTYECIIPNT